MSVKVDVFGFKCFNQLRNGVDFDTNLSEFTPNLVGNVGEKVKVEYTINLLQAANTQGLDEWNVQTDPTVREIIRTSGSFKNDGIQVGDVFDYFADWTNRKTTTAEFRGEVDFVSSDGLTLRYTYLSGTEPATGDYSNVGLAFDPLLAQNQNTALYLKFGLLNDGEPFNFISKTTGSQQVYYVGGLAPGDPAKEATSLSNIKDWQSGKLTVEWVPGSPEFYTAQYVISHEFILNPFYILAYRDFLINGGVPELLEGDNSLLYAAEMQFRKTLTDTASTKTGTFEGLSGSVGWYGENFNGLNPDYALVSTAYEDAVTGDPVDGFNINASTKATVTIEKLSGAITDYSCAVYVYKAPTAESQYIGTVSKLPDNYILKSEVVSSPATTSANVQTSIVGGDLVIEYTLDYLTAEKLQLTTDDEFVLAVQVEDPTKTAGDSDRVMVLADFTNYVESDFISGFIEVSQYRILQFPQFIGESEAEDITLSNEDAILLDAIIGADTTKDVVINSISLQLLAYNSTTNESFTLDTYDFAIGDPVFSGGVQQLQLDTTRGYPLPEDDEFNFVKAFNLGVAGDFERYSVRIGQKTKWQDWIFNPAVNSVFFDSSQPNNGLNFKSSNYSNEEGFQIKLALVLNVTGEDDLGRLVSGNYIHYGSDLTVHDYDESDDGVTGEIETYDIDTGISLGGNVLFNGKDTLFRAVFQNAGSMDYGIHRIEPSQNPGDGILELSSNKPFLTGSLLKPKPGESQLTFDLVGSVLTTECLIDGTKLQEGVNYKLSARVSTIPAVLENPFTFTIDTTNTGDSTNLQFQLPLLPPADGGNYDMVVDKGDGSEPFSVTTWNAPETLLSYAVGGVYTVQIYGVIQGFAFEGIGDRLKILDISNWGTFQPVACNGVFAGCSNMDVTATDIVDLSQTNSLLSFFEECTNLVFNASIGDWDTSGVMDTARMFRNASAFNQPLNSWNTSAVTTMQNMFTGASVFNADISLWDVSACTNMDSMFSFTGAFNIDISAWNTSAVTTMRRMFIAASAFNQPLNSWNTSAVTTLESMFENASVFNQPLNSWDTSAVTTMDLMFRNASAFNQPLNSWNTSAVTTMGSMFIGASVFNADISLWDVSACTNMDSMFSFTGAFNIDISAWNTSAVTTMRRMFRVASAFNQPLNSWNTSAVTTMEEMFDNASAFNQPLNSWDTSAVTTMRSMFRNADVFNQPLNSWNTSAVTTMGSMFAGASVFNADISLWDVSACTDMSGMFEVASAFNQDVGPWQINALTNATAFLNNSGIDTTNLDAILNGWASVAPAIQNNVVFDAATTARSAASDAAVTTLTSSPYNWTINTL